MPGHLLGVLEPSVVFQVDCDAGCPPCVTSDWREKKLCASSSAKAFRAAGKGSFLFREGGSISFLTLWVFFFQLKHEQQTGAQTYP